MIKLLKEKIRKWLLEVLQPDLDALKEDIAKSNDKLEIATQQCQISTRQNEEMKKMYNQITDVAVDVGFINEEHSWAVVCIAGKPEYVKFIPLNGADARTVIEFLRHFQYSNQIVDSPFFFKDMLKGYCI